MARVAIDHFESLEVIASAIGIWLTGQSGPTVSALAPAITIAIAALGYLAIFRGTPPRMLLPDSRTGIETGEQAVTEPRQSGV